MKIRKRTILLIALLLLFCGGCQGSKPGNGRKTGEAKPSAGTEQGEDAPSEDQEKEGLEAWYDGEKMEQRVEFDSTKEEYDQKITYRGVLDQSALSGHRATMNISLKTPELSQEEVKKLGEYYFRHYTIAFQSNVVQWEMIAKSQGKEKYHFILRYGDRYRTRVACYSSEKAIGQGKYELSDIVEGERKAGEKVRYCFEKIDDNLETHEHPQLKRGVKGQMDACEMDILDDADAQEIARAMTEASQKYVDEVIKEDEETRKVFLGIRLTIRQFGNDLARDVLYLWDKDKKDMKPYTEENGAGFLSQGELEKKIVLP